MEAGALRAPAALNRISVTAPLLRLRSDEQLVALFRAGNDAAFNVIHDRYRQRLFAYSRQMLGGSRQDAEDALQDVFMRAYSSLRSNDRPLSLRAWLYRVAHNRCIDQLRKPAPPAADLFDTSRKPLHDPMDEVERREDLRRLIADVRRLPEQQRSALLMREIDGLSYAELGDALGISLQAVKSLLVRARIGLVEAVEARDTACSEIRLDLADAFDRGVRASGLARRHLRDCDGCVEYRAQLRGVRQGLAVLAPGTSGPFAMLLKLVGLGGAGSAGAASAGGGAAAGSGVLAAAGTGTAAKVAAVVCCAALTAGGAVEVRDQIVHKSGTPAAVKQRSGAAVTPTGGAAAAVPIRAAAATAVAGATAGSAKADAAKAKAKAKAEAAAGGGVATTAGRHLPILPGPGGAAAPAEPDSTSAEATTGGAAAPHEDSGADGLAPRNDPESGASSGETAPATGAGSTAAPDSAVDGGADSGAGTAGSAGSASGSSAPG
jgi:RNA polymerase sigma factor (sigma-70 family)